MVAPSGMVKEEIFLDTPTFLEKFLDETYRVQTCKNLEQDLIYTEALDRQGKQYADHILRQRNECAEADVC